jgi:hypothetical protein
LVLCRKAQPAQPCIHNGAWQFILAAAGWAVEFRMGKPESLDASASGARTRLVALRDALLQLHKTLVDSERVEYEKTMGPISSANEFLRLLSNDPWFAWLAPLTRTLVNIDESLEGEEPLTEDQMNNFASSVFALLIVDETGHGFGKQYFEALQRDPDVVMAHAAVAKMRPKQK